MKESEKISLIYEQQVQKEKYPLGFSPVVDGLSLDDVVEGSWSLREKNGKVFVDVQGSVNLSSKKKLKRIPWTFGVVSGDFNCSFNRLETLEGAPEEVGKSFYCFSNRLKTLEGAPEEVGGEFDCSSNQLKTLEGAPEEVGGEFDCSFNRLETLKGAPKKVRGNFDCSYNRLQSLEEVPFEVGDVFSCHNNLIEFTEEDIRRAQARSRIKNTISANNRERFSLDTFSDLS